MRSKPATGAALAMMLTIAGCRLFATDGAACRGLANCPDGQWCCGGSCREAKSCTLRCNDNADCPGGYMCHPSDLVCVPALKLDCTSEDGTCPAEVHPGDPCPSAGSFVPCTNAGGLDCSDGCRTCGDDLTWSTCSTGECAVGIPTACADCDHDCTTQVLHAEATCDTSVTPAVCSYAGACATGWADLDLSRANGCEAVCVLTNGGTETCDNHDNDCDGTVDDVADATVDCRAQYSVAVSVVTFACTDGACHVADCVGTTGDANGLVADGCECSWTNGGVERCDNVDNDCDGVVDDGLDASCKCANGQPKDGAETCGNGIDDDCNSEIDEDCPAPCTPSSVICDTDGRTLQTCNLSGYGYNPTLALVCPYLCRGAGCITPSNIPNADLTACTSAAPALTPSAGATLTLNASALTCVPNCDGVSTASIAVQNLGGAPPLAVICVSRLAVPTGVTLTVSAAITPAIAFIVDGDATLNGTIDFSGRPGPGNAPLNIPGGRGGPGGGAGAAGCTTSNCDGLAGNGPGGGGGGTRDETNQNAGGAGGGGGFLGSGGHGGAGTGTSVIGAPGATYGAATLVPLQGGSGGGSGSDGTPGTGCGPGGGGGGALQIVSRGVLTVTGTISASGGAGGDQDPEAHGAGGGGSGGAVLLEAPTMVLLGNIAVVGGAGGAGAVGVGGAGAVGANVGGSDGRTSTNIADGASGGGGGSGRVRVNRLSGSTCSSLVVSPTAACIDGTLP